jgi:peptidyl-prolyl cis-trans isomerase B (cyclophilin B)
VAEWLLEWRRPAVVRSPTREIGREAPSVKPRSFVRWTLVLSLVTGFALAVTGCSSSDSGTTVESAEEESPADAEVGEPMGGEESGLYTPEYQPTGDEVAIMTTGKGVIRVELYGDDAPIHVGNFVELSQKGFYDGTKFHRYEPGFVIQGGDPQTKEATSEDVAAAAGDPASVFGTGDPGYKIKAEFDPSINPNKHVEGALGMARSQDPNSAGSQFYFTLSPAPMLDGQYTVFGQVREGMDVVQELRAGDVIESLTIEGASE